MRMAAVAILLWGGVAWADGGGAPVADLKACKGLPHGGAQVAVKDDAVIVNGKYLAFPALEGGGCEVYRLDGKLATTKGAFGDGTSAVAIRYGTCEKDSCPVAVAIRGAGGKVIAALRTDASCNRGVDVHPVRLAPDHDDLMLVCRSDAGAGYNESTSLLDLRDHGVALFYTTDTGGYIALSPAEKKAGMTPSCPIGSITVEKVDASKPLLRIASPDSGSVTNGKGVLAGKQYAYDPAHHKLTPTGAPDTAIPVDAHLHCK